LGAVPTEQDRVVRGVLLVEQAAEEGLTCVVPGGQVALQVAEPMALTNPAAQVPQVSTLLAAPPIARKVPEGQGKQTPEAAAYKPGPQ